MEVHYYHLPIDHVILLKWCPGCLLSRGCVAVLLDLMFLTCHAGFSHYYRSEVQDAYMAPSPGQRFD